MFTNQKYSKLLQMKTEFFQLGTILRFMSLFVSVVAFTTRSNAQLNADATSDTIFMIGYANWWGNDGVLKNFKNSPSAATQASRESAEISNLQSGLAPLAGIPEDIYVRPSLSATIQTSSGVQTFSAIPFSDGSPGYNSNDDSVIDYHAKLLYHMGVRVLIVDMSNQVNTLFANPVNYSAIEAIDSTTYDSTNAVSQLRSYSRLLNRLDALASSGITLYVAPLLQASNTPELTKPNSSTYSAYQNQLKFVIDAFKDHPGRTVTYGGNPLILNYVAGYLLTEKDLIDRVGGYGSYSGIGLAQEVATATSYPITLRYLSGLVGFKSGTVYNIWNTPAAPANARKLFPPYTQTIDGVWSWFDQVYISESYVSTSDGFSSYAMVPGTYDTTLASHISGERVEAMAVNISSWGWGGVTYSDPHLAYRSGEILNYHMSTARKLHPKFVILNQFNQHVDDSGGYSIHARTNVEPTIKNGTISTELFDKMQSAVASYRLYEGGNGIARITDLTLRGQVGVDANSNLIIGMTLAGASGAAAAPQRVVMKAIGPSLGTLLGNPPGWTFAGNPKIDLYGPASFYVTNSDWNTYPNVSSVGSALAPRTFKNSASYLTHLNYTAGALSNSESAITADLDPGAYSMVLRDQSYTSSNLPGPVVHHRVVPSDLISDNRITEASLRGYVSTGDKVIIIGFTLDKGRKFDVFALGSTLSSYGISNCLASPGVLVYSNGSNIASWSGESSHTLDLVAGNHSIVLYNTNSSGGDGIGFLSLQEH